MNNVIISIFGNKIFSEIISEIKLFSNNKILYYDNIDSCIKDAKEYNHLVIYFLDNTNKNLVNEIKSNDIPTILIAKSAQLKNLALSEMTEKLNMPFKIIELKKIITILMAKYEFKNNSLIQLSNYTIDKNERKIKKDKLELQLSEKEINFLILFSKSTEPISKNLVLTKVWNYSSKTETHTVETQIHRLRKKILQKFGDNNFIKNNNKGYYI